MTTGTIEQAREAGAMTWKLEGQLIRIYAGLPCRPGTVVCVAEVFELDSAGSNPAIRFLGHDHTTTLGMAETVTAFVRANLDAMEAISSGEVRDAQG